MTVHAPTFAMKLHFPCQQSGWNVTRKLGSLTCIWDMGRLTTMDESHGGCTSNVTQGVKLQTTPFLPACTRDCPIANPPSCT
ncbi:hypothetical protein TNCV_312991 [Trichonephila clavipes]|nr:hypothetical protein TNCV_312991 [Trichonephila clavipes]